MLITGALQCHMLVSACLLIGTPKYVLTVCNGDGAIMALQHFLLSFFLFFFLSVSVKASALTTSISANERICFFADVDKAGEKIGVRCWLIQRRPTLTFVWSSFTSLYVNKAIGDCSSLGLTSRTDRCNQEAHSTLILTSKTPTTRLSWMARGSARVTTFSPPTPSENTLSVLRMTCRR